jgi:hypothetical protein
MEEQSGKKATYHPKGDYFTIPFPSGEIELDMTMVNQRHGRPVEEFKDFLQALKKRTNYTLTPIHESLEMNTNKDHATLSSEVIYITIQHDVLIPAIEQLVAHHS